MQKALKVNENLLQKLCIDRFGATLGAVAARIEIEKAKADLAELNLIRSQIAALDADIADRRSAKPGLESLESARDAAFQKWLAACAAFEERRLRNEGEISQIADQLLELRKRERAICFVQPRIEFVPLTVAEKAFHDYRTPRDTVAAQGEAKLIGSRASNSFPAN